MGGSIGRLSWGRCPKCPWYNPFFVVWEKEFQGAWEHMFDQHGEFMPTRAAFRKAGFKRLRDYPMPRPTPYRDVAEPEGAVNLSKATAARRNTPPDTMAWETVKDNVRKEKSG